MFRSIGILTLCLVTFTTQAGTLVYNTFPDYPYWVWGGGGHATSNGDELGISFSPFQTGNLSELRIAIGTGSDPTTTAVTFHLRADSAGTPGAPIESFYIAGQIPLQYDETGPFSIFSSAMPLLEAGQTYWLTVATTPGSEVVWHNAHWTWDEMPPWIGNQAIRRAGSETFDVGGPVDSALQVYVNVVPVPAAVWLFGSALGVMGWMRRRSST